MCVFIVSKAVVRNAYLKGKWGAVEERQQPNFPFVKGGTFDLIILADHDGFKVPTHYYLTYLPA